MTSSSSSTFIINIHTIYNKSISLEVSKSDTVENVKNAIFNSSLFFFRNDFSLVYMGKHLRNHWTLEQCSIGILSSLFVIPRFAGPHNFLWSPFIYDSYPKQLEENISCDLPEFCFSFKIHQDKKISLHNLARTKRMQNLWQKYTNFQPWADPGFALSSRVAVLKLRPEFTEDVAAPGDILSRIESVKYNCNGANKSYYGGDNRSWQRYTFNYPISTSISLLYDEYSIHVKCKEKLYPETWYALVLFHTDNEADDYIYEDFLIPFKTKKKDQEESKQVVAARQCIVCLSSEPNILFQPCGHVCCCSACDRQLLTRHCPKCRTNITKQTNVYFE